ncbi:MAG: hypothetical protein MUF44_09655 [Hydrogenophaga sp.]|jgi:hypothetical protein|nr:hypothetical protein [Hydrogenophaga sp.]
MNSSPTPSSPIRSRPGAERRLALALIALGALLVAADARAHGEADDPLPPEPGITWDAAAALRSLKADKTLPSTRLDGYLLQGDAGVNPDGTELEHGALGLAVHLNETWGGRLVVGKHGSEAAEIEEAWVQVRHDADNGDVWRLNAGRQRPAMGAVLGGAGHFDRFGLMPLASRAATAHHWVDDGLQLSWRRDEASQWSVDLGLWRGRGFPGSLDGSVAPSLHLGWGQGPWQADALWAGFRPQGRGATVSATADHSHSAPVCDARLTEVICFSGDSDVMAGSLRWSGQSASASLPLTLSAAGWLRQDRGRLASANGLADYTGRTRGGWLEAVWHLTPQWELGTRVERLSASHALHGAGASLLVNEARLQHYQPVTRNAAMLGAQLTPWARWTLEVGRESGGGTASGFVAMRLLLQAGGALGAKP